MSAKGFVAATATPWSCQLVASHMCSRVWGNSDSSEGKRNAEETGHL